MRILVILVLGLFLMNPVGLLSQSMKSLNKKADGITSKSWAGSKWSGSSSTSGLSGKSFPIQKWDKRYSSLGSQRAGGAFEQRYEKKTYEKKFKSYEKLNYDMSGWNEYMSSIHERAGIQTDQRSKKISNRALYSMMLQDTRSYKDLAEKVSLRDVNRFQFRRNRPEGEIPVERAAGGDSN